MLTLKGIQKNYKMGMQTVEALRGVDITFRDCEFVSILGPSGCGKTTLLNIIGGLDRYDSGDLIINNISTEKYGDREWDAYRNHTIGFVFQSYNLIPHQTVLANVELALTISGISAAERKKRATEALIKVGLGDQLNKKPNQMSGGQMQRVAIARALVNDPDILLADEPTGALDSTTSTQVMELLKEVASDRLVIMVTHNPDLALEYANRIVKLKDGRITDDSNPVTDAPQEKAPEQKKLGKAYMSFATALGLSFNNLRTKKARTILTSFAGSIGIIGIALILALSNGVNAYIGNLQKDTMASYPITIASQTLDMNTMISIRDNLFGTVIGESTVDKSTLTSVYSDSKALALVKDVTTGFVENDLTSFKEYLDRDGNAVQKYVGENGIVYTYDTKFNVYYKTTSGTYLNTSRDVDESTGGMFGGSGGSSNMLSGMLGTSSSGASNFSELLPGRDGTGVSKIVEESYELVYGSYPQAYNEVVLVLSNTNSIYSNVLCQLGLITDAQYRDLKEAIDKGYDYDEFNISYEDVCKKSFYLLTYSDYYVARDDGTFTYVGDDGVAVADLMKDALELKVVGVIRPSEDQSTSINTAVAYTTALTDYIIKHTDESAAVKAQQDSPDKNVLTGMEFAEPTDEEKAQMAKEYLSSLSVAEKANFVRMIAYIQPDNSEFVVPGNDVEAAAMLDGWLASNPDNSILALVFNQYFKLGSYDENMSSFGKVSYNAPTSISIYCDSFEAKDGIAEAIAEYNTEADEDSQITYTDYVALMTSSITSMVDIVSYVLIAFVSVSLVVSCIMIAIITHISVMERTKEIGILRAIGASKRNVSEVFNAETFIIGICSGLIGVGISVLLTFPINAIIHALTNTNSVNAVVEPLDALWLVVVSVAITVFGGLIPAGKAAKLDPAVALRTE